MIVVDVVVPRVRHERVEYVRASITSLEHMLNALHGAHAVIHTASIIPNIKLQESKILELVNTGGTQTIVEACKKLGLIVVYAYDEIQSRPLPILHLSAESHGFL